MSNPNEITIAQGQEMIDRFKNSATCVNQIRGAKIEKSTLDALLNLPNCSGISAYYGLNDLNQLTLILIAFDSLNNEISQVIMDRAQTIPPNSNSSPFVL